MRFLPQAVIVLLLNTVTVFAQTSTPPAAGDGSFRDPYHIATVENLHWLSQNSGQWGAHFKQTADITASAAYWTDTCGHLPIGTNATKFTGSYDGNGYVIDSLYVNRDDVNSDYIGMFGYIDGAELMDIRLTNVSVAGEDDVGGLFGRDANNSVIRKCGVDGTVTGTANSVGGLAGRTDSGTQILSSRALCAVTGYSNVGGLVGNHWQGTIRNCYARGTVAGDNGSGTAAGGLAGYTYACIMENCYAAGTVSASADIGGLAGKDLGSTNAYNCFWDSTASGLSGSIGGTPKTTVQLKSAATFTDLDSAGLDSVWNFYGTQYDDQVRYDRWEIEAGDNDGYPILEWEDGGEVTYVTGALAGKEIWYPEGNPYIVTGNIIGSTGDTLEILPGVEVRFGGDYYIDMQYGHLGAVGTLRDSIIFTSNAGTPAASDWNMLYMRTSSSVHIEYAVIAYNTYGVWARTDASDGVIIRHCNIHDVETNGLYIRDIGAGGYCIIDSNRISNAGEERVKLWNTKNTTFSNNKVFGSGTHGVHLYGSTAMDSTNVVINNTVTGTGLNSGIYLWTALPKIINNTVSNFWYGISTTQMSISTTDYTFYVTGNTVTGCGHGIYVFNYANPVLRDNNLYGNSSSQFYCQTYHDIDARNTYWGESATAEMDAGGNPKNITDINDGYDDGAYAKVIYEAWLDTVDGTPVCSSYTGKFVLGDSAFQSKAAFQIEDTVFLEVSDYDLNGNIGAIDTASVTLQSGIETTPESFSLIETGNNTGVFRGFVLLDSSATPVVDGKLQLIKGDNIIATYSDTLTGYNESIDLVESAVVGYEQVTGALDGRVVWTTSNSPYLVTGDVTVGWQDTLVIEAGVRVCFNAGADDQGSGEHSSRSELIMNSGYLIAQGTATDSIIFTSSALSPSQGDWENIYFSGDCDGIMEYCHVSYATNGVFMDDPFEAPITVRNCRFDNVNQGVYVLSGDAPSTIIIDSTLVYEPASVGIYVNTTHSIAIEYNTVVSSGSYGIYFGNLLSGDSKVSIRHNTLSGTGMQAGIACWESSPNLYGNVISNYQQGIYCRITSAGQDSTSEIMFNELNGTIYDISSQTYAAPYITFNNLRTTGFSQVANAAAHGLYANYNYWDAATTADMDAGGNPKNLSGIYDSFDNGAYGAVDYDNWLPEEIVNGIVVYSAGSDTATEDSAYQYVAQAAWVDGTPAISFSGLLHWMNVSGDTVYGTPDDPVATDTSFMVIATGGAVADTQIVTISITAYNDQPAVTSASVDTATEDVSFQYVGTASDPDDTPDISYGPLPGWLAQYGDTLRGTPLEGDGDTVIAVTASDGARADTVTLQLAVTAVNDAPTVTSSVIDTATEDALYQYVATADDPDDTPVIGFGPLPGWLTQYGDTLRGTPGEGDGDTVVEVMATDGVLADTVTLQLAVTPVNDAPVAVIDTFSTAEESMLTAAYPGVLVNDTDPDDINAGLMAYWNFDTALQNGQTYYDASGNGNDATVYNGASSGSGKFAQGLALAGDDDYARIPNHSSLNPTSAITISVWIKPADITTNLYYEIYRQDSGSNRKLFSFQGNGTLLTLGLNVGGGYIETDFRVDPAYFTDGNWHQVAYTYDGAAVVLYIDGYADTSTAWSGAIAEETAVVYLGCKSGVGEFFDGSMDDVGLWDRALTPDELAVLYNRGTGRRVMDSRTVTVIDSTRNGAVTLDANGSFTYDPQVDFNGSDTLLYQVADAEGLADTGMVVLTVTPVNDGPVLTSVEVDTATEEAAYQYIAAAADPDNTPSIDYGPLPGWLTQYGDTLRGTPDDGDMDTVFMVYANDGAAADSMEVSLTVIAVNDAPVLTSAAVDSATEETAYQYIAAAADPEDTPSIDYGPLPGWLTQYGDTLRGTPDDGDIDTVFMVYANDGAAADSMEVSLTVIAVNDAPVLTSAVVDTATEEAAYRYIATATDPDDTPSIDYGPLPGWLTQYGDTLRGTPDDGDMDTVFMVYANDGAAADSMEVSLTVIAVNDAPVLTSAPVDTATEEAAYQYIATATDPDDTPSIDYGPLPGWLAQYGDTLKGTPDDGDIDTVFMVYTNDGAAADSMEVSLTVIAVNDAPVLTSAAVDTATEEQVFTYVGTATDVDDTPVINYGTLPSWMAQNGDTVSGTPDDGDGDVTIMVYASDGGLTDSLVLELTVIAVNDAPVFTSVTEDTATEDVQFTYTPAADDPDDGSLNYSFGPLPGWLAEFGITVRGTPAEGDGDTVFWAFVDDGEFADSQLVTVTVLPVNDAPVLTSAGVDTATEETAYQYIATATDPDDTPSIDYGPLPGWLTQYGDTLRGTPDDGDIDTVFMVYANDGAAADSMEVSLTVIAVNDAPVLTSAAVDTATEGTAYQYIATAADPDDTPSIDYGPLPGWLTQYGDTLRGTPDDGDIDTVFMVYANDGAAADSMEVSLTVIAVNDAPVLTSAAVDTATEEAVYQYIATATDPDNTPSIDYGQLPGWLTQYGDTLKGMPDDGDVDTVFMVYANDGAAADSMEVSLTVVAVNDAPVLTSAAVDTATEEAVFQYIATATDPDDTPSIDYGPLPGWLTQYGDTLRGTPDDGDIDTVFMVYANDGAAADSMEVSLTVIAVNDAPVLTSAAVDTATEEAAYQYIATATDPDDTPSIDYGPLPGWLTQYGDTLKGTPDDGDIDTVFMVYANDGAAADSMEVNLTVLDVNDMPVIQTSNPDTLIRANEAYVQAIAASDADGDTLQYSLLENPAGMTIDGQTGDIAWAPDTGDVGSHAVTVQVSDTQGGYDTLAYALTVLPAVTATEFVTVTGTYGFDGIGLSAEFVALTGNGGVTATVYADSFPPNASDGAPVKRFFSISAETTITGMSVVLTLSYTQAEFDASDITSEATLYAARWNGTAWEQYESIVDTAANTVSCTTDVFSIWSIGGEGGSVPVELSSFTADAAAGGVLLAWTTESERDNYGFNVLRSDAADGKYIKVNTALIMGVGTSSLPQVYSFTDVDAGTGAWYYRLQIVALDGSVELSDAVSAVVQASGIGSFERITGMDRAVEGMFMLNGAAVRPGAAVVPGMYLMHRDGMLVRIMVIQ